MRRPLVVLFNIAVACIACVEFSSDAASADGREAALVAGGQVCDPGVDIACDDIVQDTTVGHANFIDLYLCSEWTESGPEIAYRFTTDVDTPVTATLSDLGDVDLDVFVLEGECAPHTCIEFDNEVSTFIAATAIEYFIVVDGYEGAEGAFTLTITCGDVEICDDQLDNDGDQLIDCDDPDCDLDPTCVGACCYDGTCTDRTTDNWCLGRGGIWHQGRECVTVECPWACCLPDGSCRDLARTDCNVQNGVVQGPGTACASTVCPKLPECPATALGGQLPDLPGALDWRAGVSDADFVAGSLRRYDNFGGLSGPVCDLHWWGLDIFNDGAWGDCDEEPMTFDIRFYEHSFAAEVPGMEACSYVVDVPGNPTGYEYTEFEMKEYHVEFPICCLLSVGWVSIQGTGGPDCWFLWTSSPDGDGTSCSHDGFTLDCSGDGRETDFDLSWCLTGSDEPLGVCCVDGQCIGTAKAAQCTSAGGAWFEGEYCATFICPQACCRADGTCDDAASEVCIEGGGAPQGPGSDCASGSCPEAEACCFPSGEPCEDFIPAICEARGGVPGGPDSSCTGAMQACCFEQGSCRLDEPVCCSLFQGTPQGPNTMCLEVSVACCYDDGCAETDPLCCDESGGVPSPIGAETCLNDGDNSGVDDACETVQACCLPDGSCQNVTLGACEQREGIGQPPDTSCGDVTCPSPPLCPDGSLYGQAAHTPGERWGAYYADDGSSPAQTMFDNFAGVTDPICDLHWWGFDLVDVGPERVECDEDPPLFEIKFYRNAASGVGPGEEVCSYRLPVARTALGVPYLDHMLNYYGVDLPSCCVLESGWVSIQGTGEPECWFFWLSSQSGDGVSCAKVGETVNCTIPNDLGFCLTGVTGPPGGCCLPSGRCEIIGHSTCESMGGTYLGAGTDCDPNCCMQPVSTGADDCTDATVVAVPIDGTTVTLSGDNSTATANDCIGQRVVWWESFEIDSCADVVINYCCTDPMAVPVYLGVNTACPECAFVNATASSWAGEIAGCEDGNFRGLWENLAAGTYHYPIHSDVNGSLHGPYQLHVTAYSCTAGACCVSGACIDATSRVQCQESDGIWYDGAECSDLICPGAPEACCFADFTCSELLAGHCAEVCPCDPDMNCDGVVDSNDTSAFLLATTDPLAYLSQYPDCNIWEADLDCDGSFDEFDRSAFECVALGTPPPDCLDLDMERCVALGGAPQAPGTACDAADCSDPSAIEIDVYRHSIAEMELTGPSGTETIFLSGPEKVVVYFEGLQEGDAFDDDGDGLDEVRTVMQQLDLTGSSPSLGPVAVRVHPTIPSLGAIIEHFDHTTGTLDVPPFGPEASLADSFFDVFFEVEVAGLLLHTEDPKRLRTTITYKPPGPGDFYESFDVIDLYDETGNRTGWQIGPIHHTPGAGAACCLPSGDCEDLHPTACELRQGIPRGVESTCELIGDLDADGDVDEVDWRLFVACLRGPDAPVDVDCFAADLNCDGKVDMGDVQLFVNSYTG